MTQGSTTLAVRYGRWLFKYLNKVFTVVMLVLLLGLPPVTVGHDVRLDRWVDVLGIAIAAAGQILRAAVIGLEYIKRGGVNKQPHADKLVTGGMFAHCRNPLYVGNLLILAGLFVIHNHPLVYVLGGLFYLSAYYAIVLYYNLHIIFGRLCNVNGNSASFFFMHQPMPDRIFNVRLNQ